MKLRLPNVPPGARFRLNASMRRPYVCSSAVTAPTTPASASAAMSQRAKPGAGHDARAPEAGGAGERERHRSARQPPVGGEQRGDADRAPGTRPSSWSTRDEPKRRAYARGSTARRSWRPRAGRAPSARRSDRARTACTTTAASTTAIAPTWRTTSAARSKAVGVGVAAPGRMRSVWSTRECIRVRAAGQGVPESAV